MTELDEGHERRKLKVIAMKRIVMILERRKEYDVLDLKKNEKKEPCYLSWRKRN